MTATKNGSELAALADRISATPAYSGRELRVRLECIDGGPEIPNVEVILVNAAQRDRIVAALRSASAKPDREEIDDGHYTGDPRLARPITTEQLEE